MDILTFIIILYLVSSVWVLADMIMLYDRYDFPRDFPIIEVLFLELASPYVMIYEILGGIIKYE